MKPELKLRPMTDLTGSQSPIDPKTQNIFDHDQEESFMEMIKRNQSGWLNIADPELAANTSFDSIAGKYIYFCEHKVVRLILNQ